MYLVYFPDGPCSVSGVSMVWVPVVTMLFWSPQVLAPHPEERALRSKYKKGLNLTNVFVYLNKFAI